MILEYFEEHVIFPTEATNPTGIYKFCKQYAEDYPPFVLLKDTYKKWLKETGVRKSKKEQEAELLNIWASAHGLAAIACMSGVETTIDWEKEISAGLLSAKKRM